MATTTTNTHAPTRSHTGLSFAARLSNGLANLREGWILRSEYNRTLGELSRLSDRELADIGLRRCDLHDVVSRHVYGRA